MNAIYNVMSAVRLSFLLLFICLGAFSQENTATTIIDENFESVYILNWLVAGEFPSEFLSADHESAANRDGYMIDFLEEIGGEKNASIKSGTTVSLPGGEKVKFRFHKWDREYVDLVDIFGESANVCAYLYAELESYKKQDVYFHAGFNDAGKVWLNGELVIEHPLDGQAVRADEISKVTLKKGANTVLLKIDQAGGGWGTYFQVLNKSTHKAYLKSLAELDFGKDFQQPNSIATHVETKVLCKQENRYIGWPTIAKTKSGELLAVFSGDRDAHVCPYGVVQLIRSTDNGKTWSAPETICDTPLDDRDAGIIETKDGTLVVSWFTSLAFDNDQFYKHNPDWKKEADKLSPETREYWLGNWTRRSTDNGKTWEEPVKQNGSAPHGPIQLENGRLIYVGIGEIDAKKVISVEVSMDAAKTWQIISTIPIPEDEDIRFYHEPHVVELPDGKLVTQIRYQPQEKAMQYLRQSESLDGGKTWSIAHKTPMWGYPPHLIVLDNGWLLSVYGVRRKPYSQRASISKDGGKTWDIKNEIIIQHAINGDLGYPASVQLDDDSILTVYYQIDQQGEKTCLMGTKWRLK